MDSEDSQLIDEQLIEERKKQIKSFFLKNRRYLQYILLLIIVWIGASIRVKSLRNLIDSTTGKYISLELDSTVFLRYAEYIAENGRLFDIDPMRFYPLGADLEGIGAFVSYFIAYLYKILNFFIPSITIEYVDIIYPIIAMAILTVFLFLLVRRLFDWKVGLLSAVLINIIPTFIFRSLGGSSDHDILAMMLIVMSFYFIVLSWQSRTLSSSLLFGIIAGITTGLAKITAGAASLIFLTYGVFFVVQIFLNKFNKKDYYSYITWIISASLILVISGGLSKVISGATSISIGPAYFALLLSSLHFVIFNVNFFKNRISKINLPAGVISMILSIVIVAVVSLIFSGPSFIYSKLNTLYTLLFKAFATSRWTLTVAENHRPYVTDWFGQMGKIFVFSFIIGSIILFYNMVKPLKRYVKTLTWAYAVFILMYIFSRYSQSSTFNGENFISKLFFFGGLIGFFLFITGAYLYSFFKQKEIYSKIAMIENKYIFIFIWFIVMIFAATSAIRLLFEFSVIVVILASYFFVSVGEYGVSGTHRYLKYVILIGLLISLVFITRGTILQIIIALLALAIVIVPLLPSIKKIEKDYLKYSILIILLILLLNPFTFAQGIMINYYNSSNNQAKFSGPGYNQLWQQTGQWVRENLSEDAIFAHWWDYGYWVQSGFERTTIGDGGNFYGWWNYLMGRTVLTGQNEEEALKFLFAHGATHLLIVSDEVGKYPAYSSIGSDLNFDRYSFIPTFHIDPSLTQERRDDVLLFYRGAMPLGETIQINDNIYPKGSAGVGGVLVAFGNNENGSSEVGQPEAIVVYQGQQVNFKMSCLYFNGQLFNYEDYDIDSCLRIMPVLDQQQLNQVGAGMYLVKTVKNSNFARLYLFNQESRYFKQVYTTPESQVPFAIINGRLIGPHKIWEINYPEDLSLTEEEKEYNLRITYPDERLMLPPN